MSKTITVKVPDIGDFSDVPVIEILVSKGDEVEAEQSLMTLESDKATLEVPAPQAGTIGKLLVELGDTVSEGDAIVEIQVGEEAEEAEEAEPDSDEDAPQESRSVKEPAPATAAPADAGDADLHAAVLVLGSGPGGYTAAFRAADLGQDTVLVERYPSLGGVCLNVGCIPSKALLHTAEIISATAGMAEHGVEFGKPKIDLDKLRGFKDGVVGKLTQGLGGMARQRKVKVVQGEGRFVDAHTLAVEHEGETTRIRFEQCIIAVGSRAIKLPGLPWDDSRLMDSTDALMLEEVPRKLLVVGGGIIGMEMASVYSALGASVTVVELMDQLMPGADKDLVRVFHKHVKDRYEAIHLNSKVVKVEALKKGLKAWFEGGDAPEHETYDRILVSVGRSPNGLRIGAEQAGIEVSDRGFIPVDDRMRTNVPHIFAIGDVVGQPMLAHKATHEGKVAAEVCAGMKSAFDARVIPSVAYTDPEVAWVGLTEWEAKEKGIEYGKGVFPWAASGRALGLDRSEGMTKLLFDEASDRIIGAGIVGPHAGDLIAEAALAIEMGCEAADLGLTIHPHPTLSETVCFAAEAFEGTITDLYMPRKKPKAG